MKFRGEVALVRNCGSANEEESRLKLLAWLNDVNLHERLQEPLPDQPGGDA
jgi:hypothetical protein